MTIARQQAGDVSKTRYVPCLAPRSVCSTGVARAFVKTLATGAGLASARRAGRNPPCSSGSEVRLPASAPVRLTSDRPVDSAAARVSGACHASPPWSDTAIACRGTLLVCATPRHRRGHPVSVRRPGHRGPEQAAHDPLAHAERTPLARNFSPSCARRDLCHPSGPQLWHLLKAKDHQACRAACSKGGNRTSFSSWIWSFKASRKLDSPE